MLSALPDYYVFDDLYLLRRAKEINASGGLTNAQIDKLLFFLGWQIRARLRFNSYSIPNMTEDEVEPMNDALREAFRDTAPQVYDLQREWLLRLAARAGAPRWGFKMPSAFTYLKSLRTAYPDLKVIYNMRDPHAVLASFKHMPTDSVDGDPRQYHPLYYALYWRKAMQSFDEYSRPNPKDVQLVLFEELTRETQSTAEKIARFLNVAPPDHIDVPPKPNSSHGKNRKSLTGLETWLVNRICGKYMVRHGYALRSAQIRPGDFVDLARTTLVFLHYRLIALPRKTRGKIKRATQSTSTRQLTRTGST